MSISTDKLPKTKRRLAEALLTLLLFMMGALLPSILGQAAAGKISGGRLVINDEGLVDEAISLRGEWKFYPMRLLSTEEVLAEDTKFQLLNVPGPWNDALLEDGRPLGSHGYGTYVLRIDGLDAAMDPAVYLRYATSSYRLFWITPSQHPSEPLLQAGQVTRDAAHALPQFLEGYRALPAVKAGEPAYLVIQVANYHWVHGGMFFSPMLDTWPHMHFIFQIRRLLTLASIGMIIMLMLYNAGIYLRQRDQKAAFWLALACGLSLFSIVGMNSEIYYLMARPSTFAHGIFRYIQTATPTILLAMLNQLIRAEYPSCAKRWVARLLWALVIPILIVYGFMPFSIPEGLFRLNQIIGLIVPFLIMSQVVKAYRMKIEGTRLSLWGFGIFFLTLLNEFVTHFRYVNTPSLIHIGIVTLILLQSQVHALKSDNLFRKTQKLSTDLEIERDEVVKLNQTLEARVTEQTREIRSIMDHIKIGIFTIGPPDGAIQKDYSLFLEDILGSQKLSGIVALDLLFEGSNIYLDQLSQIVGSIAASLGEDPICFQLNSHVLPSCMQRKNAVGEIRQYEMNWNPMVNEGGIVDKILITISDVTELRQLESSAQSKTTELELVGEILAISEDSFNRLLVSGRRSLQTSSETLLRMRSKSKDLAALKTLFINAHTLKGAARTLQLSQLADAMHTIEQSYAQLQQNPDADWNPQQLEKELQSAHATLDRYEHIVRHILKRNVTDGRLHQADPRHIMPVLESLIDDLKTGRLKAVPELESLFELLGGMAGQSLSKLVQDIAGGVSNIAGELNKPVPEVRISMPEVRILPKGEYLLRDIFVHLLRNALDHGIESPEERRQLGKPEQGLLLIHGYVQDQNICLTIEDDGRGLEIDKLKARAIERGLIVSTDSPSELEIAQLIFADGISTARKLTEISGRGVGMAAVLDFLQSQRGSIAIELNERPGILASYRSFRFHLQLPDQLFLPKFEALLLLQQDLDKNVA